MKEKKKEKLEYFSFSPREQYYLSTYISLYLYLKSVSFIRVSRTHLSILPPDLNNAVVGIVSIRPPISIPSSPLSKPLGPFQEHQLQFISLLLSFYTARSKYLSLFSFSLIFTRGSTGTAKIFFFCLLLLLLLLLLFTPLEFFSHQCLADGFSLEFE